MLNLFLALLLGSAVDPKHTYGLAAAWAAASVQNFRQVCISSAQTCFRLATAPVKPLEFDQYLFGPNDVQLLSYKKSPDRVNRRFALKWDSPRHGILGIAMTQWTEGDKYVTGYHQSGVAIKGDTFSIPLFGIDGPQACTLTVRKVSKDSVVLQSVHCPTRRV